MEWLDISWNNHYLNHHNSKQGFFTASNVQVRAPINNKSVGGWQNYSKLLQEPLDFFKINNFKLNSFEKLSWSEFNNDLCVIKLKFLYKQKIWNL